MNCSTDLPVDQCNVKPVIARPFLTSRNRLKRRLNARNQLLNLLHGLLLV